MNEQDWSELDRLKQRQARLEQEMTLLSAHLKRLEQRRNQEAQEKAMTAEPVVPPASPIPPIIPASPVVARNNVPPVMQSPSPAPAPAPAPVPSVAPAAKESAPKPPPLPETYILPPLSSPPPPPRAPEPPAAKGSFEMRLGTYWLVRIGIVLVLTSLVFFGNLAYQNVIRNLGPGWKVSLLYLASGLLLGAGAWWQRKAVKESLKNYAQVLFAGGLAAVYFTTYAAYHIERLRVIESPGLDGTLLFAWAGFMVWIADRKKSEVLALFAVGLAYYTSIITHVGLFTLYSNVLLTAAAVFFLVRNRWVALSAASLVATYAAYTFWRFFDGSNWHWASGSLWTGTYFLICYWVLFTAAVFLSKHEKLSGHNRAAFLTLNNGAFFGLFILTMLQVHQGGLWKFLTIYGSVLIGLAEAARRYLASEPQAKNSYLTQGLVLFTAGIISKYMDNSTTLALMLAAESVVLLTAGQYQKNWILLIGSYLSAALSVGWGMDAMWTPGASSIWFGTGLGALMLVNSLLVHFDSKERSASGLRARVSYFTLLALAIWFSVTWNNTSHENFPLVLAAEAVALTMSFYLLRVREIPLFGQAFMVLAQLVWIVTMFNSPTEVVWWKPVLLIAASLGLSHWWQKQKSIVVQAEVGLMFQALYALAITGMTYGWLAPKFEPAGWLAFTSLLAIGITAYGVFTRAWLLAACGQIFMAISGMQFIMQMGAGKPDWYWALAPAGALAFLSLGTVEWFRRNPSANTAVNQPLLQLARVYRWVALSMSIWWVCKYIPEQQRIWVFGLLGAVLFAVAGWWRNREAILFSAAFTFSGVALFWMPLLTPEVYFPDLLVILALLVQVQLGRRLLNRYDVNGETHGVLVVVGGLSLWLFLCRWILQNEWTAYLTASWSALALILFSAGILLRERVYRWLGLGILACALGRVVFIDVWKLESIYRVLSFLALGIVLLVLGFLYNKYQEKIKEWL